MPRRRVVDFLIVVALDAELNAAIRVFGPVEKDGREHFATVDRQRGGEFSVAIVNISDMGPDAAQRETTAALNRVRAQRVLLIGIAAGFPENHVAMGDLMVPRRVIAYEQSRVEEKKGWFRKAVVVKHRGTPELVNLPLWNAAQGVAQAADKSWLRHLDGVERPDGTNLTPVVHCGAKTGLGSGNKLVATELAEVRRWLVDENHDVLGLEMEAVGVLSACRTNDTPFLVIKASQDPATAEKDAPGEKDLWRKYACAVAAAFARELIAEFEPSTQAIVSEHMGNLEAILASERARAGRQFAYSVSFAESYSALRRGEFLADPRGIDALLPNDLHPHVALIGGGGTGKSTVARRLLRSIKNAGMIPQLFEMGKYVSGTVVELAAPNWAELTPEIRRETEEQVLKKMLAATTAPHHSLAELRRLGDEQQLVCVVDGVNEVPPTEQTLLLNLLKRLDPERPTYIVATARLGVRDAFAGFAFASVDRLTLEQVKDAVDSRHGLNTFDGLDPNLQQILRRPFFLSLATKVDRLEGILDWSGFFERFFQERLGLGRERLDAIASGAFASLDEVGVLKTAEFRDRVGQMEYDHLVGADVVTDKGFEHELWRDYLAARHLSAHPPLWDEDSFDRVTVKGQSFESLPLTLQQIPDVALRDEFLKEVYDWNVTGVVECLENANRGDDAPTRGLRIAIVAMIAEKQFDRHWHTRTRTIAQLREQRREEARRFVGLGSRDELVEAVRHERVNDPWFERWFEIFSLPDGSSVSDEVVRSIADADAVIGWTSANSLKRFNLTPGQLLQLAEIFHGANGRNARVVRWRVVHALGNFPTDATVPLLAHAVERDDSYMWVRYGAVRSLLEGAATHPGHPRTSALEALRNALPAVRGAPPIDRERILREVLVCARIRTAGAGWREAAAPVLLAAVDLADQQQQSDLKKEFERFMRDPEGNE